MALTRSFGSYLSIGEEVTWGTAVARTHGLLIESHSLDHHLKFEEAPHLGVSGAVSTNARSLLLSGKEVDGDVSFPLYFDDPACHIMLAHSLGKVADAGAGPYTHTMTLAVPTSSLKGLTIEAGYGASDQKLFEGMVSGKGEISIKANKQAMCKVSFIGETAADLGAQGSPSYTASPEAVLAHKLGQVTWNGVSYNVRDLVLRWDRKFERRPYVGSHFTLQPVGVGRLLAEAEMTIEHGVETAPDTAWLAETGGDMTVSATGSGNNALAITGQNAQVVSVGRPVSGFGVLLTKVKWRLLSDGTDEGIKLVFTSDDATYNA